MSLDDIAKQLVAMKEAMDVQFASIDKRFTSIDKRFTSIDKRFTSIDKRFDALEAEMRSGFAAVGEELNQAKIRDEALHGLLQFSLEAREGLRETMEERFKATDKKHDDAIDLLKNVVRHIAGPRSR